MWAWRPSWLYDWKSYFYQQNYYNSCLNCLSSCSPFWFVRKNHHIKSVSYNDPRGGNIFDPRDIISRIYVELHMTFLHTKYARFGSCGFREEGSEDNDAPERDLYGPQRHGWQDL